MNINMNVINAVLILMVIRQIREHPLDLRSLAIPVLAVGCAAVMFLRSVPAGGNDIALEVACVLAGSVMGAVGRLNWPRRDWLTRSKPSVPCAAAGCPPWIT